MASNLYIPDDIIKSKILTRLPAKSLVRFKCVCKTWKHHIESFGSHTSIITKTSEKPMSLYQVIDVNSSCPTVIEHPMPLISCERTFTNNVKVIGSCNNLFVLQIHEDDLYFLWDPSNPTDFRQVNFGDHRMGVHGFGYDRYSNDYKFILTNLFLQGPPQICSFKNLESWPRWKDCEAPINLFHSGPYCAYLNNRLHWIYNDNTGYHYPAKIVSFDLDNETWDEYSLPELPEDKSRRPWYIISDLNVYDGLLGVVMGDRLCNDRHLWVMKEYGMSNSWTKVFALPSNNGEQEYRVLLLDNFQANSRVLLFNTMSNKLVWYNYKSEEERNIEHIEIQGGLKITEAHVSVVNFLPRRQGNSSGNTT